MDVGLLSTVAVVKRPHALAQLVEQARGAQRRQRRRTECRWRRRAIRYSGWRRHDGPPAARHPRLAAAADSGHIPLPGGAASVSTIMLYKYPVNSETS